MGLIRVCGYDADKFVASTVRGFPGAQFFTLIRRQPSAPLLALLRRRIVFYHHRALERRTEAGRRLMALVRGSLKTPGLRSEFHNYWVFPVTHRDPSKLISRLLRAGFDASRAHSLSVVQPPAERPELRAVKCEELLPQIVHLPCYPEMPDRELRRMADEVRGTLKGRPIEIPDYAAGASLAQST